MTVHLEDGQLLSIIDDAADQREAIARHLEDCALCAARLDVIGRASARFTGATAAESTPSIDPRVRRSVLRRARATRSASRWAAYPMVAAATILLVASAALASPVRHWIVRQLAGDRPPAAPVATPVPPAPQVAPSNAGAMTVSFAPTDTVLTVQISNPQAAGALELVRSNGVSISARITAGSANEEFLITPGTLRIKNGAGSRASYSVAVPPLVTIIRLTIGAAAERTIVVGPGMRELVGLGK